MENKLSKIIVIVFSLIGVFLLGTIIHENIHRFDYRNVEKLEEDTCYLTFSEGKTGYYSFSYLSDEIEHVKEINKTTEFKAYSVEAFIFLIYSFGLIKFLFGK